MHLHLIKSRPPTLFGHKYRIAARLELSPEEHAAIRSHRLDRFEIFADLHREHLYARADHTHQQLKALPYFETTPLVSAALAGKTMFTVGRQITLLIRASMAFRVTVGDLVSGITITNRSLSGIRQIKHVLVKSVDAVDATISAALQFQHGDEEVLAPGTDDERHTPPSKWPEAW